MVYSAMFPQKSPQVICYSYITVGVGYLCYYTSPWRSWGQVLITKQRYPTTTVIYVTSLFPT